MSVSCQVSVSMSMLHRFLDSDTCSSVGAGLSAAIGSGENFNADAIVEKGTQITDQWSHVPLRDGKEKLSEESYMRQKVGEKEGFSEQIGSDGGQEIEEEFSEAGKRKLTYGTAVKDALVKPGSSEIVHQARYSLPAVKKEGEFSFSDMVWSKVRTYPWWPGQIFDPSDASEWAMKHYKKDCYFVAYFGDKSFAWNEASQLKDFKAHFSTMEKQRSRLESFQNAIDCALDEVSKRVEYGLACSCIPKDTYDTIKSQTVDNTGIRQEISITHGVDESQNVDSFSPMKLMEYVKTLSELPTSGFDRLELEIAKAQLLAFNRFKSFSCFQEIQRCGGADKDNIFFVDDEQDLCEVIEHATHVVNTEDQAGPRNLKNQSSTHQKRKYSFKDTTHPAKKEKRMSDPMNGTPDSRDGDCWTPDQLVSPEHSKRRSAMDHFDDDFEMQTGKKTISGTKVSNTTNPLFKIGDCIRGAASQLIPKTDGVVDVFPENELDVSPTTVEHDESTTEYSSLDDMLSSLQCVAQKPLGEYTFLNGIVTFFSDFKNSVIVAADWKEISCTDKAGTGSDTFEFEDMSDLYWTDRVIDNGNEKKPIQHPLQKNQKKDELLVAAKSPKPVVKSPEPAQVIRRPCSWEKKSENNHAEAPEKPPGYIDENAPAELVMNFAEVNSVPSETNLNHMFRHFGRLKESETEVDRASKRARVVFEECVDAEVALSSAKKFNIFGSVLVDYQLNYTPSAVFKAFSKKHD